MRQLSWAACLAALALCFSISSSWAATCYGYADCRACKNCRYCGHCAKRGGTCGVCSPAPSYQPPPRPAPVARPAPSLSVTERGKSAARPAGKVETVNATVTDVFPTGEGVVLETVTAGNLRVTYTSRRLRYPATPFRVLLTRRYGKRWNLHLAGGNPGGAVVYVERMGK